MDGLFAGVRNPKGERINGGPTVTFDAQEAVRQGTQ
jgi:hypothetical protein